MKLQPPTDPQLCVDKSYIPRWVIDYPAKEFLVDGVVVRGARGRHSDILERFLNLKRRPHRRPKRNSKRIKRLKK